MSAGVRGILFMVAGCALIVFNDVIVKLLTEQYPVGQAMFVRSLFVIPPVLLFALYEGKLANLRVHNFKGQALRSVIVVTGMFLFLTAITMMPIADALAITFAAPLMATALAVPLLGERVGWRRWSAVVVGLAGVILVLRPTGEGIAVVALLPLGSAITLALRDILTRRLSVSDSSSSILMFTTLAVMGTSPCLVPGGSSAGLDGGRMAANRGGACRHARRRRRSAGRCPVFDDRGRAPRRDRPCRTVQVHEHGVGRAHRIPGL